MRIDRLDKDHSAIPKRAGRESGSPSCTDLPLFSVLTPREENNLDAKCKMAEELRSLGLPEAAIGRILHIDQHEEGVTSREK